MTEKLMYSTVVKEFCRDNSVFVQRVDYTHAPDVYMSKNGNVLWAELKCVHSKQKVVSPPWRPGQLAWIKRHAHYGSKNICLILYYEGEFFFLPPQETYTEEEIVCQKDHFLQMLNRQ